MIVSNIMSNTKPDFSFDLRVNEIISMALMKNIFQVPLLFNYASKAGTRSITANFAISLASVFEMFFPKYILYRRYTYNCF